MLFSRRAGLDPVSMIKKKKKKENGIPDHARQDVRIKHGKTIMCVPAN